MIFLPREAVNKKGLKISKNIEAKIEDYVSRLMQCLREILGRARSRLVGAGVGLADGLDEGSVVLCLEGVAVPELAEELAVDLEDRESLHAVVLLLSLVELCVVDEKLLTKVTLPACVDRVPAQSHLCCALLFTLKRLALCNTVLLRASHVLARSVDAHCVVQPLQRVVSCNVLCACLKCVCLALPLTVEALHFVLGAFIMPIPAPVQVCNGPNLRHDVVEVLLVEGSGAGAVALGEDLNIDKWGSCGNSQGRNNGHHCEGKEER